METSSADEKKKFYELLEEAAECHSAVRSWARHLASILHSNALLFFLDDSRRMVEVNCLLSKAIQQNTLSEDSFQLLEILQRVIEENKGDLRHDLERGAVNQKISETKQEFSPQKKFFPMFEQYCHKHSERSKHRNATQFHSSLSEDLRMEFDKTWGTPESFYTAYKNRRQQAKKKQQRDSKRPRQFVGLSEETLQRLQKWADDR